MSKLEKMKECLLSSIEIDMQQIEEIKQWVLDDQIKLSEAK